MSILDKVMDFNIRQVVNKTTPEIKKGAGKLASIMLSASRKLEEVSQTSPVKESASEKL